MAPGPPTRVLIERSWYPNTLISIRSPMPSFTLELASRRGDWGEAASLTGAPWGASSVAGVCARRWRLQKATKNRHELRKRERRFRPDILRLLNFRVGRV